MDTLVSEIIDLVNKEAELKKKGVVSIHTLLDPTVLLNIDAFHELFPDVKPVFTTEYSNEYAYYDQLWSINVSGITFMALSVSGEN